LLYKDKVLKKTILRRQSMCSFPDEYFLGVCERVGIVNVQRSKVTHSDVTIDNINLIHSQQLHTVTLDNTSNNTMTCETVKSLHR
jgi:hypothetical protein